MWTGNPQAVAFFLLSKKYNLWICEARIFHCVSLHISPIKTRVRIFLNDSPRFRFIFSLLRLPMVSCPMSVYSWTVCQPAKVNVSRKKNKPKASVILPYHNLTNDYNKFNLNPTKPPISVVYHMLRRSAATCRSHDLRCVQRYINPWANHLSTLCCR